MKKILLILFFCFLAIHSFSQTENAAIANGNKFYKEKNYEKAIEQYQQALQLNPDNAVARYNLGAARFRSGKFEDAQKEYVASLEKAKEDELKHKSVYNEGVSLTKQQKLLESIASYKEALRMNPEDQDTRFNLQKALEELRKQQKAKQPKQDQQQQKKDKEKKQEPKPQPPANKKNIEQWMQSLRQKEQEVQQKLQQQKRRSTAQPEKDW